MNYDKFKTPFFRISIADPNNNRSVDLPDFILRLVDRIEIQDSVSENEFSTINIKFIEGSREPAQNSFTVNKGLYPSDKSIKGSITNRIGSLADLRFSGFAGITFTTEQEIKTGIIEEDRRFRNRLFQEPKKVRLLFDSKNQVKITWGYVEDPDTIRSIRGRIISSKANFPDNTQPTFIITATSTKLFMDMETPKNGIPLRIEKKLNSNIVPEYEDKSVNDLLKEIANSIGLKLIISNSFVNNKEEKHVNKSIIAGQSFKQFLDGLARNTNSYWDIIIDPKTGKDTLIFLSKIDFESRTVFDDDTLLTYKGPNSILKNVNITTDFGMYTGNSQIGLNLEGNSNDSSNKNGTSIVRLFNPIKDNNNFEKIIDNSPSLSIETAKKLNNKIFNGSNTNLSLGINEVSPKKIESTNEDALVEAERINRIIAINFSSLGFTRIIPGVYEINGIGTRYSGKYRIITVKHVIDKSGYITTCSGGTFADFTNKEKISKEISEYFSKGQSTSKINILSPLKKQNTTIQIQDRDSGISKRDEYEKLVYKK